MLPIVVSILLTSDPFLIHFLLLRNPLCHLNCQLLFLHHLPLLASLPSKSFRTQVGYELKDPIWALISFFLVKAMGGGAKTMEQETRVSFNLFFISFPALNKSSAKSLARASATILSDKTSLECSFQTYSHAETKTYSLSSYFSTSCYPIHVPKNSFFLFSIQQRRRRLENPSTSQIIADQVQKKQVR